MKTLFAILSFIILTISASAQNTTKHLNDAVVLLYSQTNSGDQKMVCTATAYRKTADIYRFASAAHCVSGDKDVQQKQQKFFVTLDNAGAKVFFPAKLIQAGDKNVGDDFSIFEVSTKEHFETVPLGDDTKLEIGEPVQNIAAPFGMGKQYFQGYVSTGMIDRPKIDIGDVSWHDIYLVEIGGGPGSSGSSIVDLKQQAIVGFLVGMTTSDTGKIIVPVSQFKAFEAKVDAHTYKKTNRGKDDEE